MVEILAMMLHELIYNLWCSKNLSVVCLIENFYVVGSKVTSIPFAYCVGMDG